MAWVPESGSGGKTLPGIFQTGCEKCGGFELQGRKPSIPKTLLRHNYFILGNKLLCWYVINNEYFCHFGHYSNNGHFTQLNMAEITGHIH